MNVLSLFDGMSCGRIALERAGLPLTNYYASEIDKYAITVSRANYPDIKQLGSVTEINYIDGYLCSPYGNTYVGKIDMLIGGSPCQNFSFAGKQKGMQTKDNIEIVTLDQYLELKNKKFQFEGQSFLFWEYVRLLREIQAENPEVKFLLENVKMSKKWENLITSILGVEPILINSSLVSAQARKRLYWTNIEGVTQPEDKEIFLQDIIEYEVDFSHVISEKAITRAFKKKYSNPKFYPQKTGTLNIKVANVNPSGKGQNGNVYLAEGKSPCLTTNKGEGVKVAVFVDRYKSLTVTTRISGATAKIYFEKSMHQIAFKVDSKVYYWRKLTPTECERLQTVPDNYTNHVSNSQRYKMLGNGWTVDVIAHIFSFLKK